MKNILNLFTALASKITIGDGIPAEKVSENIVASLEIMWKGMLAIFVTIIVIAGVSILINRVLNKLQERKNSNSDEN